MAIFSGNRAGLDPALLLAALPNPIIALDRSGAVRFVNPAAEQFLGVGAPALQGAPLTEFVVPHSPLFGLVEAVWRNGGSIAEYDVLLEGRALADVRFPHVHFPYLDLVPATQDLVGAELELVGRQTREQLMRRALAGLRDHYQYVIIDCPPSLGLVTLNMLAADDSVLIPIQCEYYALEGLSQLLNTVKLVQRNFNPALAIDGVLLTMYDARLNLCKQVAEEAKEYFGPRMFEVSIPRNVRLAEAPSFGKPILLYDVQSVGARSYLAVAQELIRRVEHSPAPAPLATLPEVPA